MAVTDQGGDAAETTVRPGKRWRGVVIAEGLRDPTVINGLHVVGASISSADQPIDEHGSLGRWHLYWVDVATDQISLIQVHTLHEWYAHFWRDNLLVVVYDNARFDMVRDDPATWAPAIEHGLRQGLRREWLDFPTDDSLGEPS